MTGPLAVTINVTTNITEEWVTHHLDLIESQVVVALRRDIGTLGRLELMAVLAQLLHVMEEIWREEPMDGDVFVVDMRRDG